MLSVSSHKLGFHYTQNSLNPKSREKKMLFKHLGFYALTRWLFKPFVTRYGAKVS